MLLFAQYKPTWLNRCHQSLSPCFTCHGNCLPRSHAAKHRARGLWLHGK